MSTLHDHARVTGGLGEARCAVRLDRRGPGPAAHRDLAAPRGRDAGRADYLLLVLGLLLVAAGVVLGVIGSFPG